jgi:hypothetical protein
MGKSKSKRRLTFMFKGKQIKIKRLDEDGVILYKLVLLDSRGRMLKNFGDIFIGEELCTYLRELAEFKIEDNIYYLYNKPLMKLEFGYRITKPSRNSYTSLYYLGGRELILSEKYVEVFRENYFNKKHE